MYKTRKNNFNFVRVLIMVIIIGTLIEICTSCDIEAINSMANDAKGSIVGVAFDCLFYDNEGQNFMTVHGEKIKIKHNIVTELDYKTDGLTTHTKTISSIISITIDGSQIESCGTTILFIEDGLTNDVDFNTEDVKNIVTESDNFMDNTGIASIVNKYKNVFGKPVVVVIQSQLGDPICAFSGESVYWEVCCDIPKTTKIMIDGKALYIHRANFQIIDKELINK